MSLRSHVVEIGGFREEEKITSFIKPNRPGLTLWLRGWSVRPATSTPNRDKDVWANTHAMHTLR